MRRAQRVATVVGLVWLMAGIPSGAPAQFESGPFAGFALEAWGAGFSMIYDDPNGIIPAHPTGEIHAAYALGTLSDGFGHGVATELWPGPTAATAGPFLEDSLWDGVEDGSDGQFPPAAIGRPSLTPKQWPAAAEVFWPGEPHTQDVAPGAHAHSRESLIYAKSSTVPLGLPGIFSAGAGATTAQTFVGRVRNANGLEIDAARSEVLTTVAGITIPTPLGPITIDKVTTTASVTTDGTTPVIDGTTVVSGVSFAGQGYVLDEDGFHAADETTPNPILSQLNENLEEALVDSGISISLVEPIDAAKQAEGSRSVGGLIVRMESHRLDEAVGALPAEIQSVIRENLSLTHDLTIVFGGANVRSSALKAFEAELEDLDLGGLGGDFDTDVLGAELQGGSFGGGDFGSTGGGTTSGVPAGGQVVTTRPAFAGPVEVDGVAMAAVIFGLAVVFGAANALRVLSDRALLAGASAPGSRSCPDGKHE